ncbi:MAG: fumarate reductase cytochrome b subunit [Campylobacterales bacterium]|nr:fumarate reductase cytochrome b subunit [Campylobacterales bacterium]
MHHRAMIESVTGRTPERKKSRIPAKLDWWQSTTGAILAGFIVFHMLFTSTILMGPAVFDWVVKQSEGAFLFGEAMPVMTLVVTLFIFTVFIGHAFLAMRKFPASYRQLLVFWQHRKMMKHSDTSLWMVQYITGFALFFLGGAHLIVILSSYDSISAVNAATRFTAGGMGLFYLILLVAMVSHGAIGVYRLVVKWVPFDHATPKARRAAVAQVKRTVLGVFVGLGLMAFLADLAYMQYGKSLAKNSAHLISFESK